MAVNTDRSIPDATTGLKPVHKRILYCAIDEGNTSNKKYIKCSNNVGQMLAKWHPHLFAPGAIFMSDFFPKRHVLKKES